MPSKLTATPSEGKRASAEARWQDARAMAYAAWLGGYEALALEALLDAPEAIGDPALCDLALRAPQEATRVQATRALSKRGSPLAPEMIEAGLSCASGPVRLEALRRARAHKALSPALLLQRVTQDPSPLVRRATLRLLADRAEIAPLWAALEDPVWRVRRAAARLLERYAQEQPDALAWAEVEAPTPTTPAGRRARQFLFDRLRGDQPLPPPAQEPEWSRAPYWSHDPAVLVSNIKHLSIDEQIEHLDDLLDLIGFQDGYPLNDQLVAMRALIARRVKASGTIAQWIRALAWLDEPRVPFALAWAEALALEAPPEVAQAILATREGDARLRWAIEARADEVEWSGWRAHPDPATRRAALRACAARLSDAELQEAALDPALSAEALSSWSKRRRLEPPKLPEAARHHLTAYPRWAARVDEETWGAWISSEDHALRRRAARTLAEAGVYPALLERLQADPNHRVRAAAMTLTGAERLWRDPSPEPAWRVLAAAAERLQRPLSELAPEVVKDLKPKIVERRWQTNSYFSLAPLAPPYRRPTLGANAHIAPRGSRLFAGRPTSALALSGRHALSEAGYEHALAAGINAFFWEPEYTHLTRWAQALPQATRQRLVWIGGTFSHEPQHVLRDLERMRRTLEIEEVSAFVLFWVRDEARLSDEIIEGLMEAQGEGRVRTFGFSTHDRGIALRGLHAGWPLVMVRHSGGHAAAEEEIFPTAAALGAEIITFSNLCYGLMLDARDGQPPPYDAADCYRYSLSQPGVTLSLTAPSTLRALKQNLAVLDAPTIDEEMMETMRAWSAPLREDTRRLLRQIRAQ